MKRTLFTLGLTLLLTSVSGAATAEPLKLSVSFYAAAAALDNISTHVSLSRGAIERNGGLKVFGSSPITVSATATLVDVLAPILTHKLLNKHPRIERAVLYGAGGWRLYCFNHNLQTIRSMR